MASFSDIQEAVQGVAGSVGDAVVGMGQRWGVGSGVVVARNQVLTNAHNVRGDEVKVTFNDGHTLEGRVEARDMDGDVAVVAVDTGDISPIDWNGRANGIGIGAPVLALSNPGGRGLRVTFGFVSGTERSFRGPRGRLIAGSIEHTAPLLPGSSGGPIVDPSGRFLGLNTNRLGEGFYLAIPGDESLKRRFDSLARGETPSRPRLGVGLAPPDVAKGLRRAVGLPDAEGLLVRAVEEDSPAAAAGLQEGDLLIEADGTPLTGFDELYSALEAAAPGGTIELKTMRGVEERTVTVTLA